MKKRICAIIAIGSLIWLLSIAGASDRNSMEFSMIVAQGITATAAFAISMCIGGFLK